METNGVLDRLGNLFGSMAWTMPTALFFAAILAMLLAMTAWELRQPTIERRGFLPMTTTRGDRLFIGLLGAAWIHLAWIAGTEAALWGASIVAVVWFLVVMRFG
jgi:predicted small integral membrane protein